MNGKPLISVEDAQARVLALVRPLPGEDVLLRRAAGRVLAEPLAARRDQPPFDASAMDGYAVSTIDARPGATLRVVGEAGAGHAFAGRIVPGTAARIFTGAPLPEGADRVVMQEDVTRTGDAITIGSGIGASSHVRPRGCDFASGAVLAAPRRLRPVELSLIAAMNLPAVRVARRPVVAFLSTGDELVQPGEAPRPDQIIASNALGLAAMAEEEGAVTRILPIARDEPESLRHVLRLAEGADLIVTIGGASVGDHDLVARMAGELGLSLDFHKVALRPGKPLLAGRFGAAVVLGLPGNPVSSLVCAQLFMLPALRAMQGLPDPLPRPRRAVLAEPVGANGPRTHYMRARLTRAGIVAFGQQDSAFLWQTAEADALLIRPPGGGARPAGTEVEYLPI